MNYIRRLFKIIKPEKMKYNFDMTKTKIPRNPPLSDFPPDVLRWMKKNSANRAITLKLSQICKYFYAHYDYWGYMIEFLKNDGLRQVCRMLDHTSDDYEIPCRGSIYRYDGSKRNERRKKRW